MFERVWKGLASAMLVGLLFVAPIRPVLADGTVCVWHGDSPAFRADVEGAANQFRNNPGVRRSVVGGTVDVAHAAFIEMTRVTELLATIIVNNIRVIEDSMTYVARASIRAESEKGHFNEINLYKGYCRAFPPDTEVQYWVQKWTTGWDGFCHGWIKVVDGSWTNVYLSGTVFNSSCYIVI